MRRSPKGRATLDALKLKIPVIGDLTETAIIERVCRVLSSMLRAGVDLPRSMAVTADSANNAVYRNALEKIREQMMEGQGLAEPDRRDGALPGGRPPDVPRRRGDRDPRPAARGRRGLLQPRARDEGGAGDGLFEPAIIIFMGVVVGFVAVALISAMYGIYNQVKVG